MQKYFVSVIVVFGLWSFPASAHVVVDPAAAPAGGYTKLTFRVPHGCDGSPTVKITVQIADGVLSVKPQVHPGWEIAIKKKKLAKAVQLHGEDVTEVVSEVSWSGGPLADEYMDEFGMSVKLPSIKGARLLFPVIQECKKGTMSWTAARASGHGDHAGSLPAPAIHLTAPRAGHHH
jgi:uncharacterized protein YcnI